MNQCFAPSNSLQPKINCLKLLRYVGSFSFREGRHKFAKLQSCEKSVVSPKPFFNQLKKNYMQFIVQQSKIFHTRDFHSSYHLWSSDRRKPILKESTKMNIFYAAVLLAVSFSIYMEFAIEKHQDYVIITKSEDENE